MVSAKIFCALALLVLLVPLAAAFQEWNPSFFYSNQKCHLPDVSCGECVEKGAVVSSDCKLVGASVHSEQCYGGFVQFKVLDTLNTTICLNESSDSCMNLSAPIIKQVNDSFLGVRYWCGLEPGIFSVQATGYAQSKYISATWKTATKTNYSFTAYNPDADPYPFEKTDSASDYAYSRQGMVRVNDADVYNTTITACNALNFCESKSQIVEMVPPGKVDVPNVYGLQDGGTFSYESQPIDFKIKFTGSYKKYYYMVGWDGQPPVGYGHLANDTLMGTSVPLMPSGTHSLTIVSRHFPVNNSKTIRFTIQPTQKPDSIYAPKVASPANNSAFDYASQQPVKVSFTPVGTFPFYNLEVDIDGSKAAEEFNWNNNSLYEKNLPTVNSGNHSLKIIVSQGAFQNSATVNFEVTKSPVQLTLSMLPAQSVAVGTQTNVSCSSSPQATLELRRNSVIVGNPDVQTLSAAHYNYSCTAKETQNYRAASVYGDLWAHKTLNPVALTINGFDGDRTINYRSTATVQATAAYGTPTLYLDGVQVSNPFTAVLAAGDHNFTALVAGDVDREPGAATHWLKINKIYPAISITIVPDQTVSQGTQTTATCASADPSPLMTRDSSAVPNPDTAVLPAGTYSYECSVKETQNYTSGQTPDATVLQVNAAAPAPFWAPLEQAANSITSAAASAWQWAAKLLG